MCLSSSCYSFFFFFKQKTAYEMRISDWSSDVCSSDLLAGRQPRRYATIDEALARMQEENQHLSPDRARHLTLHGVAQNEDGSYSWKFDNYVRPISDRKSVV